MATPFFIAAAYASGVTYPAASLTSITPALQKSNWNTIIFGLFHIGRTDPPPNGPKQILGDIYFNDTLIISQGKYVGDLAWPPAVKKLIGGGIKKLLASFGGAAGWVFDFGTIQKIYEANHNSFTGTNLEQNIKLLKKLFPAITTIDMDNEDNYNVPSFVAFCEMLIGQEWTITFCPYEHDPFWTQSLVALEKSHPGAVVWWNLQCYDGGSNNTPSEWVGYINTAFNGKFNTNNYIVASDWTRFWDPNWNSWRGDCPDTLQNSLARFKGQTCIGGGFIWDIDQIYVFPKSVQQHPGSGCDQYGASQPAYVNALLKGLRG